MKLIVAIVNDQDKDILSDALNDAGISATQLKSSGSFLRAGNTTFLVGVEADQVSAALEVIKSNCSVREQLVPTPTHFDLNLDMTAAFPVQVETGGAVVFVLPVDAFYRY